MAERSGILAGGVLLGMGVELQERLREELERAKYFADNGMIFEMTPRYYPLLAERDPERFLNLQRGAFDNRARGKQVQQRSMPGLRKVVGAELEALQAFFVEQFSEEAEVDYIWDTDNWYWPSQVELNSLTEAMVSGNYEVINIENYPAFQGHERQLMVMRALSMGVAIDRMEQLVSGISPEMSIVEEALKEDPEEYARYLRAKEVATAGRGVVAQMEEERLQLVEAIIRESKRDD